MAQGNATAANRAAKETQATTAAGAVVSYVFNNCTTATAANAGAGSALPATPAGYVEAVVGGNVVKIPYYLP